MRGAPVGALGVEGLSFWLHMHALLVVNTSHAHAFGRVSDNAPMRLASMLACMHVCNCSTDACPCILCALQLASK